MGQLLKQRLNNGPSTIEKPFLKKMKVVKHLSKSLTPTCYRICQLLGPCFMERNSSYQLTSIKKRITQCQYPKTGGPGNVRVFFAWECANRSLGISNKSCALRAIPVKIDRPSRARCCAGQKTSLYYLLFI